MRPAAIHQFHSGTATGDAITAQLFELQRELWRRGYVSEIYAEHIAPEFRDLVRPVSDLEHRPSSLLLVHHSMGHNALDHLLRLGMPLVTVFHSITPPEFFQDRFIAAAAVTGRDQLRILARRSAFGIAVSNHNRKEMFDAGFRSVDVLPIKTNFEDFRTVAQGRVSTSMDWLFVGRVVPNKNQALLVEAFAAFHAAWGQGHLHFVGDTSYFPYVNHVRSVVSRFGMEPHVTLHGKVDRAALLEHYRSAAIFACLSEHEGFGVPLLEAMAAELPVIALNAAAVPETMGGAGVLIDQPSPGEVAGAAAMVLADPELRDRIVAHQLRRLERLDRFDPSPIFDRLTDLCTRRAHTTVQIQGPLESSYSLAAVNRSLANALAGEPGLEVSARATEGYGDYEPDALALSRLPTLRNLVDLGTDNEYPDIVIRQMHPPRVDDSTGGLTLQYFGWEESVVPVDYVDAFNRHLDGVGVMSTFVRDVLIDSGVVVPIRVVGNIVEAPVRPEQSRLNDLAMCRRVRLLNIGSAFPRKAIDALLRAFFEEFDDSHDVSLVLKTFPNPHNDVAALLDQLREEFPTAPHVVWIDRDLTHEEVGELYDACTAYVHAARGEGFGLPVAEAMLARKPVISVASTGLADFVSPLTAAVIGHEMCPASTHLSEAGSMWAEPDIKDLRRELRSLYDGSNAPTRSARVEAAFQHISERYSPAAVATRWSEFIRELSNERQGRHIAAVTTYNSRCGIAEYSASLYGNLGHWGHVEFLADRNATPISPDLEQAANRVWHNYRRGDMADLLGVLDRSTADIVHIQYNMGFYTIPELGHLLRRAGQRKPVVLTLHRTRPVELDDHTESLNDIAEDLRSCAAIIVHQQADQERLAACGIRRNVHVIPIGTMPPMRFNRAQARRLLGLATDAFVIGTYGFLLPHKGLLEAIQSVAVLRDTGIHAQLLALCAIHPDPRSAEYLPHVQRIIRELGLIDDVVLETDYLPNERSLELLSGADVITLPYSETSESSSASLRSVLTAGRAIVATDLPIFADAGDHIYRIPAPADPVELAQALRTLAADSERRLQLDDLAAQLATRSSWRLIARRTRAIYAQITGGA